MIKRIVVSLIIGIFLPAAFASAQVLPRAGTHFSFGIPEGPDGVPDPALGESVLTLNILSKYDGKGIITSPNGYCQEFSFTTNSVTTVTLPFSFMHLKDIGKTNKGILIKTSQPVNVVFHDFLANAGEATQIYPDDALGTDYRITTWGLFNDPGEDNHSQFLITATQDNTDLTITPSVNVLGNHAAKIPIRISLNKGECYIVKADINSVPIDASLTNSTVTSSKPVSVLSAVSCGYVPLTVESCNEMLDEILPRNYTDTLFYVAPLHNVAVRNTVVFTSDVADFYVFGTNGTNYPSTNGRVELEITKPQVFTVTVPAQCYLLSEGSWVQDIGDPSMVTVLPRNQYTDTLLWFTPDFSTLGTRFEHFVSVIYPKAAEANIMLDGKPIASSGTPQAINSSPMSSIIAVILPGVHSLTSPVPIFALTSGFNTADSYSFIAGTIAPKLREDTLPLFIGINTTEAKTCRNFDVQVTTSFHKSEDVNSSNISVSYDPSVFTLISATLGPTAQGGQWMTDVSMPGKILISATCLQPFTDSGVIANLTFSAGPKVTNSPITGRITALGGEQIYGAYIGNVAKNISIQEIRDTIKAAFSLDAGHTLFSGLDTATVRMTSVPGEAVNEIDLFVTYNHDLLTLRNADLLSPLLSGLTAGAPANVDKFTDQIRIILPSPIIFTSPGIIARLIFITFVSDSISGNISLRTVLGNSRPCPLDILADPANSEFTGSDTCGYSELRAVLRNQPFKITSIQPNPSNGSFTIDINRHLFGGDPLHLSLVDMLGNEVWTTNYASGSINQKIPCTISASVVNGTYFLRVAAGGHTETQKVIIRN